LIALASVWVVSAQTVAQTAIPTPSGIYVLNENSNEQSTATAYAAGLTSSPAYLNDVAGHAIFVPIAKILPSVTTWGQFNWDWTYLDTLVQVAVANGKTFSVELEVGFQSANTYLESLPSGFAATCGSDCAPLFDVWTTGGNTGRCISANVLLPWIPNVQQFWGAAVAALAAHLRQSGTYGSLTMVHVSGLSVYDEEIRLPTGLPSPATTDTQACPDGRPAYPTVLNDASISRWQALGYSDAAVINGFKVIATAFAQAFPDRVLGLSVFATGAKSFDFPNLTGDPAGYVTAQIVQEVAAIAPGRLQVQADDLDSNVVETKVVSLASENAAAVGWQSNKHAGTGAGCNGGGVGSCAPDGPTGPYLQLLQHGAANAGRYLEVWSADVISYPQSFAASKSDRFYPAVSYEGLWWAAPAGSESGWGINFAHQGDVIFATWFTYDANGNAWWLTMTANKTAEGTYGGALYKTTGAPFSAFIPPATATQVGAGILAFTSTGTGTFSYVVDGISQSKAMVLQAFGQLPTCVWGAQPDLTKATNYQDLWWAAGGLESGWGVNLTHQGTTIFATWFTYDVNRNPLWYSVTATQTGPSMYSGTLLRTMGPPFNAVPFDPNLVTRTTVGTATFTFTDGNTGSFAYSVNDGANVATQTKSITRQVFRLPGTVCQ